MGDIFWDFINEEKLELIDNLREFCKDFKMEMPELSTRMRLDDIREKCRETRGRIFPNQNQKKEQ